MTETLEPAQRRQLPLAVPHSGPHTGRSAMTCQYKCGSACAHPVPNDSDNEYFGDIVAAQVSRRGLLKASAVPRPSVVSIWRIAEGSKRIGA